MHELIITATGVDRPGIVAALSGAIREAGGNIAASRWTSLGGRFALLMQVHAEPSAHDALKARVDAAARTVDVTLVVQPPAVAQRAGVPYRLKTYSMDQPGIVHRVTSYLQGQGVNVEEMETRIESAPFMGTPVFTLEMVILVPPSVPLKELRRALTTIGEDLNCDVDLDPA